MDTLQKMKILSSQMQFEPDTEHKPGCFQTQSVSAPREDEAFVHPAQMPNGRQIMLLKTLLTSACERDCFYCPFRAGRDFRRATFKPEEFSNLFIALHHKGIAEGLFISSGITGGGASTQDKLLDTADILRTRLGYQGYIHLKLMPGSEFAQVERAMQLADRVSVNLEAPNTERLRRLAPHKVFMEELLQPLRWAEQIRRNQPAYKAWKGYWPSLVTQFVAGGADESDLELLTATDWLNRNVHLKRAYYSAFHPIPGTPLENKSPTDPVREHRLYQASFLLRDYGFDLEELPFLHDGLLPLDTDPKLAWARVNLLHTPLEINQAERSQLLRVPGIGSKGADAIIKARRVGRLKDVSALRMVGITSPERAAPYLLFDGRAANYQLGLGI